jgi:hypothetical protein
MKNSCVEEQTTKDDDVHPLALLWLEKMITFIGFLIIKKGLKRKADPAGVDHTGPGWNSNISENSNLYSKVL